MHRGGRKKDGNKKRVLDPCPRRRPYHGPVFVAWRGRAQRGRVLLDGQTQGRVQTLFGRTTLENVVRFLRGVVSSSLRWGDVWVSLNQVRVAPGCKVVVRECPRDGRILLIGHWALATGNTVTLAALRKPPFSPTGESAASEAWDWRQGRCQRLSPGTETGRRRSRRRFRSPPSG